MLGILTCKESLTETTAETIVSITPAMAEMTELMAEPIAEKMDPY